MTIPSLTGAIVQIQASGSSGSQNIAVPSDAKLCIVAAAYYEWQAMNFSTLTLGGDALAAKATQNNDVSYGYATLWTRANPKTGTQSLVWSWSNAPDEGANIFVIFLKDVDTSGDPIRSSGTGKHASSATSSSFASSTNDLCLCVGYSYNTTDCNAAPSGAGQTERADSTVFNSCQGAIGTKNGVSGTTTMKVSGEYCVIAAVSIKGVLDPITISGKIASMRGDVQVGGVHLGNVTISGKIASMRGDAQVGGVHLGNVTISGKIASMRGDAHVGGVHLGNVTISGMVAFMVAHVVGVVEVSWQPVPPLGQNDTPGFVLWMLANSYYQNMKDIRGEGLQEPTGDNAESWGGVFFSL